MKKAGERMPIGRAVAVGREDHRTPDGPTGCRAGAVRRLAASGRATPWAISTSSPLATTRPDSSNISRRPRAWRRCCWPATPSARCGWSWASKSICGSSPPRSSAALMYFTGSGTQRHAARRAIKAGMRLNEYGLFPDDGEDTPPQDRGIEPVAAATEADIYAAPRCPSIPRNSARIAMNSTRGRRW